MSDYSDVLVELQNTSKDGVLATIIDVEGSAYQGVGVSMLFFENGEHKGMLSGGCLEAHIKPAVERCFSDKRKRVCTYDPEENDILGLGESSGCPGIVHILLEFVNQRLKEDARKIMTFLDQGMKVLHLRSLETDESFIIPRDRRYIQAPLNNDDRLFEDYNRTMICKMKGIEYFCHKHLPKPRLIIFGAGDDVIPVARLADQVGFKVVIADWRSSLCDPQRFPKHIQLICDSLMDTIQELTIQPSDYIILMTHHLKRDRSILELLSLNSLNYVGILGSRQRIEKLLSGMDRKGNLYAPIGLPISAKNPHEIAVSVVAELIAIRRGAIKKSVSFID